jgi:hypothetical protein
LVKGGKPRNFDIAAQFNFVSAELSPSSFAGVGFREIFCWCRFSRNVQRFPDMIATMAALNRFIRAMG